MVAPTPASLEQAHEIVGRWLSDIHPAIDFVESESLQIVIAAALDAARAEEREAIIKLVGHVTGVAAAIRALRP